MRKAVVKQIDGYVENVIEWAEGANWQPSNGCSLIDALDASPGDTWDGKTFIKPELSLPEPVRDLAKEIDELSGKIKRLVIECQHDPGQYEKGANNIFQKTDTPEQYIKKAMTFIPPANDIVAIEVRVAHGGNAKIMMPTDLIVEIWDTTAKGEPGSNLLGSAIINKDIIPRSWVEGFRFCRIELKVKTTNIPLMTLLCRTIGGDGWNTHYLWNYGAEGTYIQGRAWTTDNTGMLWTSFPIGWSYYFKIFTFKELSAEIDDLKARIESLERK